MASSVMGVLLSLGEGCEPHISRQDARLRYPLGCIASRRALPRERFSPLTRTGRPHVAAQLRAAFSELENK